MILPPSDARFKFCPLLKTHDDKMKFCLSTDCMMWREGGKDDRGEQVGYCGLAGAPVAVALALRKKERPED